MIRKDSDGAVYCKCGHPEWAHHHGEGSRSDAGTWFEGEITYCCWDIEGPRCKCKKFKGDYGDTK
jgi:hypothetical protein